MGERLTADFNGCFDFTDFEKAISEIFKSA